MLYSYSHKQNSSVEGLTTLVVTVCWGPAGWVPAVGRRQGFTPCGAGRSLGGKALPIDNLNGKSFHGAPEVRTGMCGLRFACW